MFVAKRALAIPQPAQRKKKKPVLLQRPKASNQKNVQILLPLLLLSNHQTSLRRWNARRSPWSLAPEAKT
jgi:hypothetical protein